MGSLRQEKLSELLRHHAAKFVEENSNRTSLITVTSSNISADLKKATIFFTVLPEEKEEYVLNFLRRKRSEFKNYVKKNMKIKKIPFFDFQIDKGEKNRQRIEELLES